MISQNVLNLVDTAMVGRLGDAALAAVGTASFLNFFFFALVMGGAGGVQAIASRRNGEGRTQEMAEPLNAALLIVLLGGLPVSLLIHELCPAIMPLVNSDPEVLAQATPYLQVRVLALVAVGSNFAFRGYWNGVERPELYLRTLLLIHGLNIPISYVLIFGAFGAPALGTLGAGIGSAVATWIGTIYYVALGLRHARAAGFLRGWPERQTLASVVRLGLPLGIQQLLFAGSFVALFWILGQVGTTATAAANVVLNLMLVAILPAMGLGIAAATLVGNALGRGQAEDAARWGWEVSRLAGVALGLLGLLMVLLPRLWLGLFIVDLATLELAVVPLQVFGLAVGLDAVGVVLMQALVGAGASRVTMMVSVAHQWGLFLPAAYLIGPVFGFGLTGIWLAQGGYRLLMTLVFAVLWRRGSWQQITV